ncbi:MAG: TolC family protein [Elusimicrobia bacterium]|nr:TolC family protein [Elusimicrobiota bacterium]
MKLAVARQAHAGAEVRSAGQRPNPDLASKGTWGDGASQVELDFVHTVEAGGKRQARVARARAGEQGSSAELSAAQADTALRTVSALYRLRQLATELGLTDEALRTFSRISSQLRSRPRLAPEQEVSRSIFELAEADYALRKAALGAEQTGLFKTLEGSLGVPLSAGTAPLPQPRQDWPEVPDTRSFSGSETRQAQTSLMLAQADRDSARAASWPDLRLGPSFQRQSGEGQSQRMFGINLGLPLPLYHRNAAGREDARLGEVAAALGVQAVQARLQAERVAERAKYQAAVAALSLGGRKEMHSQHEKVEDFFERGLISSSLVIEAHRQMLDFTRSRHEHELAAVRALWRIRAIDGNVLGEKL